MEGLWKSTLKEAKEKIRTARAIHCDHEYDAMKMYEEAVADIEVVESWIRLHKFVEEVQSKNSYQDFF